VQNGRETNNSYDVNNNQTIPIITAILTIYNSIQSRQQFLLAAETCAYPLWAVIPTCQHACQRNHFNTTVQSPAFHWALSILHKSLSKISETVPKSLFVLLLQHLLNFHCNFSRVNYGFPAYPIQDSFSLT